MTTTSWSAVCLMLLLVNGIGCRPAGQTSPASGPFDRATADGAGATDPGSAINAATKEKPPTKDTTKPADGTGRFALLVGCTRYYHNEHRNLKGPANDARLMRRVLIERYHFLANNIVVLSEKAGGDHTPTRQHIQREFEALANKARSAGKDAQIVVLLSGHGSQQPDDDPDNEADIEHDGLDEVFLPADVGRWNKPKQTIGNAIVDDDLGRWTSEITARGAALWVIVDACHSGTALRGDDGDEVARRVDPEDLGIPDEALTAARQRARESAGDQTTLENAGDAPALAAIYAAQPDELTPERRPYDSDDPQRYGLLTYTICHVLQQARSPLTYRELVARINQQYIQWGRRYGPTPLVEGTLQDRLVLGSKERPPAFTLQRRPDGDDWQIDAGRLRGLTAGTILAVYPPPGSAAAEKPLGHVKISDPRMFTAAVDPVAYAKLPAPDVDRLQVGSRCQVAFIDYGPLRMTVTVDRLIMTPAKPDKPTAVQAARLDKLTAEIKRQAEQPGAVFQWVDQLAQAKWVVQLRDERLLLLPADVAAVLGPLPSGAPAVELDQQAIGPQLAENLARIARAQNLIALASPPAVKVARGAGPSATIAGGADVEVTMLSLRDRHDGQGTPIRWQQDGVRLHNGDWVTWQVTNRGREAVDVSLLYIDSRYGIDPLFPRPGRVADNRLQPGQSLRTIAARVNATKCTGVEQVVVVAVVADGPPVDFTLLAQPTLDAAHGALVRGDSDKTLATPLGRLLQRACYASGTTRGLDTDVVDNYQIQLVPWRVMPPVANGDGQ